MWCLFMLHDVAHLMAVLAVVFATTDVNPVVGGGWCGTLHNQLIELVVHEIGEPLAKFLHVAQVDVIGFAFSCLGRAKRLIRLI